MFSFNIDHSIHKKLDNLKEQYDAVIIGGGPGAINAAIYSARNGLSTLMVAYESGGQLLNTNVIDNYLGYYNISGEDLNNKFVEHLNQFDVDELYNEKVINIKEENNLYEIKLSNGKTTKAKGVIIATGGNPRKLGVSGETELTGKGVSYCVICDGAFYINKEVVVVGGGNSALEAALDLSKYAKNIHIVQIMDHFTGDKVLIDKVLNTKNISYQFSSEVVEILGDNNVKEVLVKQNNQTTKIKADGIFIEIGIIPNSGLVKDLVKLNNIGEVITNIHQETSKPGIYAIGDVTNFPYKQVITAASQGAVAALSLNKYINK